MYDGDVGVLKGEIFIGAANCGDLTGDATCAGYAMREQCVNKMHNTDLQ
jgi:hypothetical protein